jgi:hypothetical protein
VRYNAIHNLLAIAKLNMANVKRLDLEEEHCKLAVAEHPTLFLVIHAAIWVGEYECIAHIVHVESDTTVSERHVHHLDDPDMDALYPTPLKPDILKMDLNARISTRETQESHKKGSHGRLPVLKVHSLYLSVMNKRYLSLQENFGLAPDAVILIANNFAPKSKLTVDIRQHIVQPVFNVFEAKNSLRQHTIVKKQIETIRVRNVKLNHVLAERPKKAPHTPYAIKIESRGKEEKVHDANNVLIESHLFTKGLADCFQSHPTKF